MSAHPFQRKALEALPEIRRTIWDRESIMDKRPETRAELEPRIQILIGLECLLNDLAYVTYSEGEKPE